MKNKYSIICVWAATLVVLLSTVVMHHHHYEAVCIDSAHCSNEMQADPADGAEEAHTHQESGRSCCRIHQMHNFIVSSSVAKTVCRHVGDGASLVAALPDTAMLPDGSGSVSARWQHKSAPLSLRALSSLSRRGPPVL